MRQKIKGACGILLGTREQWAGRLFLAFMTVSALAAPAKDFHVEYRKNAAGLYTAVLRNDHSAAITAYIAQAAYDGYRERNGTLGGDTLGFTNGEDAEVPAHRERDTGRSGRVAPPAATRVLAVIYADGVTEGDDEVIAMLLAGRHRAYADLGHAIPVLEKVANGESKAPPLTALFEAMQAKDQEEGATLDDMQDAPGRMRYRFFLSAVPTQGLQFLQAGGDAAQLLVEFRGWRERLGASKPDVR